MPTALVTGASGGIGSAIARRLAEDGFAVIVGFHSRAESAAALIASLPAVANGAHVAHQIAVDDPSSLAALSDYLGALSGGLDVLVNCAGVTEPVAHDDLDALDDALVDRIFATNWRGPFATIRAARPALEIAAHGAAGSAVIVNISSIAGVTGQGSNVAYCASKAALDSMTRSLGRALGPSIRVMSVSPGWVMGEYADRMPAEMLDTQRSATPMGRLATPEDVAGAVSAVVNHLPFSTGAIVSVDGGRPLGTT